jgi:hypothetical protein
VRVSFVAQPYDDQSSLLEFLERVCADPQFATLTCVVAWAKRSGLSVVAHDLEKFAAHGNSLLLVGISQGGATRQGLELAIRLFTKVYVVHDAGVTFHPKVYLAEGYEAARLFVGSQNMTAGGLQANYEAALDLELDLRVDDDRRLLDEIHDYVKSLIEDDQVVLPLDEELVKDLATIPSLGIKDEDRRPEREPDEAIVPEAGDLPASDIEQVERPSPFGKSREKKRVLPRGAGRPVEPAAPGAAQVTPEGVAEPAPAEIAASTTTATPRTTGQAAPGPSPGGPAATPETAASAAPPTPPTTPAGGPTVVRRWFKQLMRADAQQPLSSSTNVTGSLRLTQFEHPIDQGTYFRNSLFGGLPWAPDTRPRRAGGEAVEVEFDVRLPGRAPRKVALLVAHDPSREAGQGNFSTSIHWGPLMPDMQGTDFTGQTVSIERLSDDTFRLSIAPAATGPFVA